MPVSCDNHMTAITAPLQVPCEHEELRRDLKQRNIEVSEEQEDGTHTYYLYAGSKAMKAARGPSLYTLYSYVSLEPSHPNLLQAKKAVTAMTAGYEAAATYGYIWRWGSEIIPPPTRNVPFHKQLSNLKRLYSALYVCVATMDNYV